MVPYCPLYYATELALPRGHIVAINVLLRQKFIHLKQENMHQEFVVATNLIITLIYLVHFMKPKEALHRYRRTKRK